MSKMMNFRWKTVMDCMSKQTKRTGHARVEVECAFVRATLAAEGDTSVVT